MKNRNRICQNFAISQIVPFFVGFSRVTFQLKKISKNDLIITLRIYDCYQKDLITPSTRNRENKQKNTHHHKTNTFLTPLKI